MLRSFLSFTLTVLWCQGLLAASSRPNVLFIALDDLRPELGCYGQTQIISPNIDRLAARGVVFTRAYCQYPVCNASRSSIMTGLRPDSTGVSDNRTKFRAVVPDVVTLPQQFKRHGYHTQAFGKIYHGLFETANVGRTFDDPVSWSAPHWYGSPQYYFSPRGIEVARRVYAEKLKKGDAPPDADEPPAEVNFDIARQNIDLLVVLQNKTKGNLTGDEERLLDQALTDLKARYAELRGNR